MNIFLSLKLYKFMFFNMELKIFSIIDIRNNINLNKYVFCLNDCLQNIDFIINNHK